METYVDKAINAIREYLIFLLKEDRWCDARRVGGALEAVLNTQQTLKEREIDTGPTGPNGESLAQQEAPRRRM